MTYPVPVGIEQVAKDADRLYTPDDVEVALDSMARDISKELSPSNPLLLSVMIGGLITAGKLLPRLHFPLEVDYIHVTRYRGNLEGRDVEWRSRPNTSMKGRAVLIVDDILDEGVTLAALVEFCREHGAAAVYTAVLVDKDHERKSSIRRADFTGLVVLCCFPS